jgi:hypothetical protein
MDTIGERVDYLRKKSKYTYTALALIIEGITGDGVRKAITKNSISNYHINILSEKLGWDKNWIYTGEGVDDYLALKESSPIYDKKNSFFKPIPFYNLNISAGNISFLDGDFLKNQEPDDYLHVPKNVDADIAFPTFGHSMYPEISNGDRVAYKFIKDWSFFNYGMKYLIITDEQRMVKYLRQSKKKGNVLLTSRNEDYEDIEMPINSIRTILQVRYVCKVEM